jgi:hypothetical protein
MFLTEYFLDDAMESGSRVTLEQSNLSGRQENRGISSQHQVSQSNEGPAPACSNFSR